MALRHEKIIGKRPEPRFSTDEKTGLTKEIEVQVEHEIHEVVHDFKCKVCGKIVGELRFPVAHGRPSDDNLERELLAQYSHLCDEHK